jgi:hypothetical protein
MNTPNIYQRLLNARLELQSSDLKKTGNNKFAGYKYFELGDFLPKVQEIFNAQGLLGVVSYGSEEASLTIINIDNPEERIVVGTPMSSAALKGAHEIQNLGAVQTYLRRYLWVTAMEIVEHDALDSSEPIKAEPKKEAVKPPAKHVKPADSAPWKITLQSYEQGGWAGAVLEGAKMALELATTPDDVVQIFKVNRELLDQLSKEMPEEHKNLLTMFSETKTKLLGE